MGNVTLNVSGTAKVTKISDGETGVVWNGGSGFAGTVKNDMKLAAVNIGANNSYSLLSKRRLYNKCRCKAWRFD